MRDGWLQKWEYISISQRNTFLLHEEIHLVKDEFHWSQKWFIAVLHSTHTWHDILLSVVPFCVLAFCHKWIMEESLLKLTYFSSISVLFKNSQKLDFSRNLQCKKSQQLKTIFINLPFFLRGMVGQNIFLLLFWPGCLSFKMSHILSKADHETNFSPCIKMPKFSAIH